MLTLVEASGQGSLLSLPLGDITEGYSVQDITGLDPVKATIVSSGYATQDGEQYHSSRREKRNIVLTLGLEPDYSDQTARQLRNRLYEFFMPKSEVSLRFYSEDESTVEIGGRVESFESPQFTQKPMATISILCFDPDFIDLESKHVAGTSVSGFTEKDIDYEGTVEAGFVLRMMINQELTDFSFKNRAPDGSLSSMDFSTNLHPGDILEVSTVFGSMGVYLIRGSTRSSLLYALSPYSQWIRLFPGLNHVRFVTTNPGVPFTIDYIPRYGGL